MTQPRPERTGPEKIYKWGVEEFLWQSVTLIHNLSQDKCSENLDKIEFYCKGLLQMRQDK